MTPTEYTAAARDTESNITPEVVKRFVVRTAALRRALKEVCHIIEESGIDQLKKEIFYGKVYPLPVPTNDPDGVSLPTHRGLRVLHGLLGLISEIPEIYEAIGKPNQINFLEELGDVDWYLDLLVHTTHKTREEVWEMNIKKLADRTNGRYKSGKFTEEEAINRDNEAELAEFNRPELIAELMADDDDNKDSRSTYPGTNVETEG